MNTVQPSNISSEKANKMKQKDCAAVLLDSYNNVDSSLDIIAIEQKLQKMT